MSFREGTSYVPESKTGRTVGPACISSHWPPNAGGVARVASAVLIILFQLPVKVWLPAFACHRRPAAVVHRWRAPVVNKPLDAQRHHHGHCCIISHIPTH